MLLPRILTVLLGFTLFVSEALTQDTLDDETATEEDPGSEESTSTIASDSVTRDFVVDLHSLLKTLRREAYPYISELMADDKMSRDCMGSLLALARGIQEEERWALMMLSSVGVLPQNMFRGSQAASGSYEQCLDTEKTDYEGKVSIRGQYCTLFLPPSKKMFLHAKGIIGNDPLYKIFYEQEEFPKALMGIPMAFRYGICTPNQCSQKELNYAVDKMINKVYGFNATVTLCRTKLTTRTPSPFQYSVMFTCALLAVLLIAASIIDRLHNEPKKKPQYITPSVPLTLALMFSPQRNVRRLFAPYSAESKPLAFLNGIKVLFAAWVVYGHNILFASPDLIYSIAGMFQLFSDVSFQVVANAFLSVTGFFFLSGFILSYMCLKESEKIRKNNAVLLVVIMFVRRYYRLIIPYLACVAFSMLFPLWIYSSSDGLSGFSFYGNACYDKWWATPAMMSNFLTFDQLCLGQSWYVSADLQLFIIAAVLVMLLIRKPKITLWLLCGLTAASCLWVGIITYVKRYDVVVRFTGTHPDQVLRTIHGMYLNTITHLASYMLGIICGYVTLNYPNRLPRLIRLLMWIVSFACTAYVTFGTVFWYRNGFPSRVTQAVYGALHRSIFCIGLFWFIFACVNNMAPNIRRVLAHPIFAPIGRLTFGIYLVHPGVIAIRQGLLMGQVIYPEQFLMIQTTLGCLCISVGAAFLLNISVESPLTHLDNYIFASLTSKLMGGQGKEKEKRKFSQTANPPETTLSSLESQKPSKKVSDEIFERNQHLNSVIAFNSDFVKSMESQTSFKIRL